MFIFIACVAFIIADTAQAIADVAEPLHRHGLHARRQPLADDHQGARAAGHAGGLQLVAAAVRPGVRLHHAGRVDSRSAATPAAWAIIINTSQRRRPARAHLPDPPDHSARGPGHRSAAVLDPAAAVSASSTAARAACSAWCGSRCTRWEDVKRAVLQLRAAARSTAVSAAGRRRSCRRRSTTAAEAQSRRSHEPTPAALPPTPAARPVGMGEVLDHVRAAAGNRAARRRRVPQRHQDLQRRPGQRLHRHPRRDVRRRRLAGQGRVRLRPRAQRLRQEHDPAADRRPGAAASADDGRGARAGPAGDRPGRRPRHGVSGLHQLRPSHGARQRHLRPGVPGGAAARSGTSWAATGSPRSA